MIEFFHFPSPNGMKVAIFLEEAALDYEVRKVDIGAGEQFAPAFLAISPNNKIPAIIDHDGPDGEPLPMFESGAILTYLAEKTGRFLPASPVDRSRVLQWLFWQVGGLGPMAGQAHHFRAFAPEKVPYGIKRYTDEVNRLYGVLDRALARHPFVAGEYSIADMACWPWVVPHERQGQRLDAFPNVERWFNEVGARDGVQRGMALGHEQMMDQAGYRHLYGQTAGSVTEAAAKRSKSQPE